MSRTQLLTLIFHECVLCCRSEVTVMCIYNYHTLIQLLYSHSYLGLKRKHDLEEVQDEEEEDEGVLIPPSQKRNKPINNDSLSVVNTLSLR